MTHNELVKELENLDNYATTLAKEIEKDKGRLTLFLASGEPEEIHAMAIGNDKVLYAIWESLGEQLQLRGQSRGVN